MWEAQGSSVSVDEGVKWLERILKGAMFPGAILTRQEVSCHGKPSRG